MSPCNWVCVKGWFLVCIFSHCTHPTVSRQQLIILISVFDQRDIDGSAALYSNGIFHFLFFMCRYPGNVLQIQFFVDVSVCLTVHLSLFLPLLCPLSLLFTDLRVGMCLPMSACSFMCVTFHYASFWVWWEVSVPHCFLCKLPPESFHTSLHVR